MAAEAVNFKVTIVRCSGIANLEALTANAYFKPRRVLRRRRQQND